MKFNIYPLSLAAMLCISLLPSCTTEIDPPPPPQDNYSSSFNSPSSTIWCLYGRGCINIVSEDCPSIGGQTVQSCPAASSSSSIAKSSSSGVEPSSNSTIVSSSSVAVIPSSSSLTPSSSALQPSSSSSVSSSTVLCSYGGNCTTIASETCQLVGGQAVQSCYATSSSSLQSSSSVVPSCSSVVPSSSSVVITYTLICAAMPTSGTAGTAVTPPIVTCSGSNGTSIAITPIWQLGAPNWTNPVAGTYSNISVSVNSGNCNGKSTICSGTLTIIALSSSSSVFPSSSGSIIYGTPVTYGGETYGTVVIGSQTWFNRNLNYAVEDSKCYNDDPVNCSIYGRLYNWTTAMSICPSGWHLPSDADWDKLVRYIDGTSGTSSPYKSLTAGKYLKATSGWNEYNGKSGGGTDDYGFAALPDDGGYFGSWWSATEDGVDEANYRGMHYKYEIVGYENTDKSNFLSVRCLKDD